jgi:hypothetical protein
VLAAAIAATAFLARRAATRRAALVPA